MKVSPYNLDAIKKYGYEGVLRIENERRGIVEAPLVADVEFTAEILPAKEGEDISEVVTVNSKSFERIVADHGGSVDAPEDALQGSVIPELSVISIPDVESSSDEFDGMTLLELRDMAKNLGIQKYWLKREDTLKEEILEARKS